jgi:DNA-binding transcriptional MerR regulator
MPETEPETYTLDQAADSLGVAVEDVRAYVEEGLVTLEAPPAGPPVLTRAHMRRLWSVVTLHRDLGINLPGVSAVLRLREQYEQVRRDLATLVDIVERELGPDVWDRLWPEDRPTPHATVSVESTEEGPPPAKPPGEGAESPADRPTNEDPDGEPAT